MAGWYSFYAKGTFFTEMAQLEYSMQQLLEYDNVRLYFPATYEMITDLDSYKDDTHYDMEIQYQIFEEMRDDQNRLTKDNYKQYVQDFREMVLNCDFEKLFR